MSEEREQSDEPTLEIRGWQLKSLFVFLKEHEDELNQENFSTLRSVERALFEYMSIEEVELLIAERPSRKGDS